MIDFSASDLGRAIGAGLIDPVELTEEMLERAAAHPDRDRIFTRLTPKPALAGARAARERGRSGARRSLLDGVPVTWKDLFDTAGLPTEAGSRLLAGRVPGADALVLQRAKALGLTMLGKTHMTELAFSGLGLNPMTATPPNVNDPGLAPGGSSSGAAASVAFGLAAAAIGSDTGGSVRLPAAWNNLTGLKTTHGWLPLEGVVPLIPSFDTVGPLTRSAEDAGRLAALMAGDAAPDLTPLPLTGARLSICTTLVLDDLRDLPGAAFEQACAALARAGAVVSRTAMPEVAEATQLTGLLFAPEAWAIWRGDIEAAPERMYPPIRERFRSGAGISAADHIAAWRRLRDLRAAFWQNARGLDAVLMPTSAILPPETVRLLDDPAYFSAENLLALRNTRVANLLGGCALTLPAGSPACGITLMAAPGQDLMLSRLGISAEAALAA